MGYTGCPVTAGINGSALQLVWLGREEIVVPSFWESNQLSEDVQTCKKQAKSSSMKKKVGNNRRKQCEIISKLAAKLCF